MSCAVFLSNLVERAFGANFQVYQYGADRLISSSRLLPPGSYTITADAPEGVTCYIETTDSSGGNKAFLPASGEYTFPCTLDLSAVSWVILHIGYAGFRGEPIGTWTDIDDSDVQNVGVTRSGSPAHDIYETVMIRPDEIPDSDTISKAVCAKSTLKLTVFPHFEAWKFAKRGETLVRVMDLEDGMIFRGRVSEINDRMSAGGAQSQVLTCLSSADFMEDTGYTDDITMEGLDAFLGDVFAAHNGSTELARRLTFTLTGSAKVSSFTDYIVQSHYKVLSDVLTGGKYLSKGTGTFVKGYKMEWWERYYNDVTYIDIAERLGTDCGTAILIGDNLKEINIDRGLDGGLYTSVMAVSGVCADGYRMAYTAYNDAMYTRYGGGRQAVVINNDIYFSGAGGREPTAGGGYNWHTTPETEAAQAALKAFAEGEAAKLSDPPIKITLTAADLAKMGYTGYEPFEVYNTYPVVYPPGGLFGQRMRLTAITRRLSDGQITSMTVESGEKLADSGGGTLSAQMVRASAGSSGDDAKVLGILNETTGGLNFYPLTQEKFDEITEKDDNTIYYVDDDGDVSIYKGSTHISTGGGGDEPTIETAAVLTSEQMTEWAPEHELVPVDFRGSAHIYYAQPPAKIVIQGQRGIYGNAPITTDDLAAEIVFNFTQSGQTVRQKLKVFVSTLEYYSNDDLTIRLGTACYNVTGAAEVLVGFSEVEYDITLTTPLNSISVGILLIVESLITQDPDELAAQCRIQVGCISGQNQWFRYANSISGSLFNRSFPVDFGSDAEREFASGIARRTEPSS